MPQDGTFVSATPSYMDPVRQDLNRTQPVAHANGAPGMRQNFRGTVGTNSTVYLATSPILPLNWRPSMMGAAQSVLQIYTSTNRVGTGTILSHEERVANPKPGAGRARTAYDRISRLNRIQGIIRAPIDQVLEMEVLFGEYHGSNTWKGTYASGGNYEITSAGAATHAQIRLTCNNPINPGPFNFFVNLMITPAQAAAPAPAAEPAAAPQGPTFMQELSETFWEGMRGIEGGRSPFQ